MDLGLSGKKVIMNGGSGCDVAFFSSDQGRVDAAAEQVGAAGPGKVHATQLDMTGNPDGYKAWLAGAVEALGGNGRLGPLSRS